MKVITDAIDGILANKKQAVIAIDGRCASGKTTLAERLKNIYNCNVIHMDDFFLRKEQRTSQRLDEPGGNVDRERFLQEVLIPLSKGDDFLYRPFDCKTMTLKGLIKVTSNRLTVVEGSYCCHPELFPFYDLRIFCDVDQNTQRERLLKRNPQKINDFTNKWIPMEEKYFLCHNIKEKCDLLRG